MLDINSDFALIKGLAPIVGTDDTALVTDTIDLQGYSGAEFLVMSGVLADVDATFTVALFHGDASNMSDEGSALSDTDQMYGAPANWTFANDGAVQQFGYNGKKRYLRVKITPANNTGSAPFAVAVLLKKKKVGTL